MSKADYRLESGSLQIELRFKATTLGVLNGLVYPLFLREGANDVPEASNADFVVPPGSFASIPVHHTWFAVAVGTTASPIAPASLLGSVPAAFLVFTDERHPPAAAQSFQQPKGASYLDKNPVAVTLTYDASTSTIFGETVRQTYTVPAGKSALLQNTYLELAEGASTTGIFTLTIYQNATIVIDRIFLQATSVNDVVSRASAGDRVLQAGDVITIANQSNKAIALDWFATVSITEFDA